MTRLKFLGLGGVGFFIIKTNIEALYNSIKI